MPWVRIDENAMDHPKIAGLPAETFRLWVQALAYCQKFLTDGHVSEAALRGLRSFSVKRRDALVAVGLWEPDGSAIHVHDFLDWNESREHVSAVRKLARERMQRFRAGSREQPQNIERTNSARDALVPSGWVVSSSDRIIEKRSTEGGTGETADPSIRAGQFCQWYEDTHQRLFRVGYMGTQKDYQSALQLVAKFTDQELRDAALVWFGMDDDFAVNGTRSIPKFASRISGCLQRIHEQGIA